MWLANTRKRLQSRFTQHLKSKIFPNFKKLSKILSNKINKKLRRLIRNLPQKRRLLSGTKIPKVPEIMPLQGLQLNLQTKKWSIQNQMRFKGKKLQKRTQNKFRQW